LSLRPAEPELRAREDAAPLLSKFDASRFLVVYVALLLLIPSQLVFSPLGAAGAPAAIWGMAGLVWWVLAHAGALMARRPSPVRLAVLLFTISVLASYVVAMSHGWFAPANVHGPTDMVYDLVPSTAEELRTKMISAADRGLLSLAGWVGVMLMAIDGLRSWADLDRVVTWLLRFAAVVAVLGILQFFTGWDVAAAIHIPGLQANTEIGHVIDRSILRRATATAIHPIEFGVVLGAVFPLALQRGIERRDRVFGWVPPAIIGSAAMMSVSRSAVLVVGVGLVVMFFSWPPRWRPGALVLFPGAVVALRLLVPGLMGTLLALWTNLFADPSTTGRTSDYSVVFAMVGQNPMFGRGLFTFIPRYYRTLDNQILDTFLEVGVVGLVATVGLFAVGYFCARGVRRRGPTPGTGHIGAALSASILGLLLSFGTFDAFTFPMAAGVSFLIVGVAGGAWQIAVREFGR